MKKIYLLLFFLLNCYLIASASTFADDQAIGMHLQGEGKKSVRIPFKSYHNLILVPVRINNSFEMNFILDTGVNTTILTEPAIAELLGFQHTRNIRVAGLGKNGVIDAKVASNLTISLPGTMGKGMSLVVLPKDVLSFSEMFGQPVFGIIGYDVFSQFVVEINYQHSYLKLHKPSTYQYKGKGLEMPIVIENTKPYIMTHITEENGEQKPLKLLIDLGATNAISLWYKDKKIPSKHIDTYLGSGLSGNIFGKLGRLKGFELGDFNFKDVITAYPNLESSNVTLSGKLWHGNIGAEILKRFHIVFDYRKERIILRKNNAYKKPFYYNLSGLEILAVGQGFRKYKISYVRKNSPADKAGIQVGDEIMGINGVNTYTADIGILYYYLNRKPGKKVRLKLKRGTEKLKKSFKLKSEI